MFIYIQYTWKSWHGTSSLVCNLVTCSLHNLYCSCYCISVSLVVRVMKRNYTLCFQHWSWSHWCEACLRGVYGLLLFYCSCLFGG